ncbi:MAG: FecR domain-containing protein, partial [Lachnospiraceae bacterium]|nr:FecR domain-containing protein [Lachnospiraceae bacterium]
MREFIGSTKGKVCIAAGIVLIAVIAVLAVTLNKKDYRSISVEETEGEVTVVGNKSNGNAYVGQHLYSGDDVTVGGSSELTMCMDTDKYMYADENTHFTLQASAGSEDSNIKIYLDEGSTLHKLGSKLGENDTYEVDTPNSTMSVRGTTFRVTVYKEAGDEYTLT